MKKVLVLFETSGAVSVPFREAGFDVVTVDILPHKIDNEHHLQIDLKNPAALNLNFSDYTLLIAFPPCTYFSKAGLHYLRTQPGRKEKQLADLEMIKRLWEIPIKHKCFENPAGSALNKLWMLHSCKIDYKDYSEFSKSTHLWLQNLPPLLPEFENFNAKSLVATHWRYKRSITPIGVGYAMVKQWGGYLE